MNYIFIFLGVDSHYEAMLMLKIINQMPVHTGIFCFSTGIQTTYFSQDQRIYNIPLQDDLDITYDHFKQIINEGEISNIFIMDLHKIFFSNLDGLFKLNWLENIDIPISVFDYLDYFEYNSIGQLSLKNLTNVNGVLEMDSESTSEIDSNNSKNLIFNYSLYPKIIKSCPPLLSKEDKNENLLYWNNNVFDFPENDLEKFRAPLGITSESNNVLLIFSLELIIKSANIKDSSLMYDLIVETVVFYLEKLDKKINLFIFGCDDRSNIQTKNVKIKTFKLINDGLYNSILSFSDLVITDSVYHPSLVDAIGLGIPTGVLGNSLEILDNGDIKANYVETSDPILDKISKVINLNADLFFPFESFPIKSEFIPDWGINIGKFVYFQLDVFSDECMLTFFNEFLNTENSEVYEKLLEIMHQYVNLAEHSLTTEELLLSFESISA